MWSKSVDSEGPNSCGHFDTKIEVVTIKILELDFLQRREPEVSSSRWRASYEIWRVWSRQLCTGREHSTLTTSPSGPPSIIGTHCTANEQIQFCMWLACFHWVALKVQAQKNFLFNNLLKPVHKKSLPIVEEKKFSLKICVKNFIYMILKQKWYCMRKAQFEVCEFMRKLRLKVCDCMKKRRFEVLLHEKCAVPLTLNAQW